MVAGTAGITRVVTRAQALKTGVGAVAAAALAACGGSEAAPARQQGPVTVTYVSGLPETHPTGAARLALMSEFNKTNTQRITVDIEPARGTTDETKAKALAAAGTSPDLYYVAYYSVADFFASGITVDVDSELKAEKDWAKQRADIFPAMLESRLWAGKLAGMPVDTNNQAMIYNVGLLQQAGVAPPKQGWTWDDFKAAAQKFVRPDVVPLSMAWAGTWRHWLGTMGGRIITKDTKKITADTPEMLEVMELYLDLLKRGIALKTPDGKGALFETYPQAKNDTVFEVQGPYRIPALRQKNAPPFMTIHIPVHPVKKQLFAGNGGWNMAIFKDVPPERRHAAALVAQWTNAPHAQSQFCIQSINIPVSKATLESKEFQEYAKDNPEFKGFADLAPYGWRWPALPSYAKINAAADNGVQAIIRQDVGVKAGLAQMQQEAQTLLDADLQLMK
jgi:multiple sugar transport system substrate-binding protein